MTTAGEIRDQLQATTEQIDAARRMVAGGQLVDLSGLKGEVETLCGAIETLPAAERGGFRAPIVSLIDELDKLAAVIKTQHAALQKGMKAVSARRQASTAYVNASKTERK
jgi:hypothetical protein